MSKQVNKDYNIIYYIKDTIKIFEIYYYSYINFYDINNI